MFEQRHWRTWNLWIWQKMALACMLQVNESETHLTFLPAPANFSRILHWYFVLTKKDQETATSCKGHLWRGILLHYWETKYSRDFYSYNKYWGLGLAWAH
jgi:hypothetical protein